MKDYFDTLMVDLRDLPRSTVRKPSRRRRRMRRVREREQLAINGGGK